MKPHTPRRANLRRWLESAPDYVLDCFDEGDKATVADRYTVFMTGPFLIHSHRGTFIQYFGCDGNAGRHPQGVGMWGELAAHDAAAYRHRNGRKRVRWMDLPEAVRDYVSTLTSEPCAA